MRCNRCDVTVHADEIELVADNFDPPLDGLCFSCAHEVWKEQQQDAAMNNPPQDEGG